jgi:acetylornithine deacetylase
LRVTSRGLGDVYKRQSWPSSVPDLAVIEGRIGVAPGEEMATVKDQLSAALRALSASDAWLKDHPVQLEFFGAQWIPNAVDRNHPFVSIVEKNFKDVYQRDVVVEASPWGTDAGLLGKIANIPSLVIGPGVTKMAHFPNEYIVLEDVKSAAKLFARIILEWCA